jgi:hypothetical protein
VREERTGRRDGHQAAVAAPRGRDFGDQAGGVVARVREQRLGGVVCLVLGEAAVVDAERLVVTRADREQVARRAHRSGGALGDARERGVEVIARDQVLRGRVHAAEPVVHGRELRLERRHELLRVAGGLRLLGVPGDGVEAVVVAAGLAGGLLDVRGGEAEQDGRLRQSALREVAHLRGADEAVAGPRAHDGAAGPDLDRDHLRDGAELRDRQGQLLEDRLRRAERAEQRRHGGAGVLAHEQLAHAAADLILAGDLGGELEEGHGLVVPDPVGDVVEVLRRVRHARALEQLGDGVVAGRGADVAQQRARHRAGDLPRLRAGAPRIRHRSLFSAFRAKS